MFLEASPLESRVLLMGRSAGEPRVDPRQIGEAVAMEVS
jgi:hypothetical protein